MRGLADCSCTATIASPTTVKAEDAGPVQLALPRRRRGDGPRLACVRKPLLVTCSLDRTVRVWNYLDHRLELWRSFSEEPHSVAFHPSGLHVVVGFSDKLGCSTC